MFVARKELVGRWVAIMDHVRTNRNLTLQDYQTRCVLAGAVHEFLLSEHHDRLGPINHVKYLGFGEFLNAGVIAIGDELWLSRDMCIGCVMGFDETHMPNHQNLVFRTATARTGADLNLVPDQQFTIRSPQVKG